MSQTEPQDPIEMLASQSATYNDIKGTRTDNSGQVCNNIYGDQPNCSVCRKEVSNGASSFTTKHPCTHSTLEKRFQDVIEKPQDIINKPQEHLFVIGFLIIIIYILFLSLSKIDSNSELGN